MCFMNDGSVIGVDAASSPTLAGPRPSRRSTTRRVGSARAAKTPSSCAEYCAMWLSMANQNT